MSRRVRRKVASKGKEKVILPSYPEVEDEVLESQRRGDVDWTSLPDDTVIQLFSCLNYRDRASLSSTCRTWRALGVSPCLWNSLDLRAHKCDATMAASLVHRCVNLRKLRFRGAESADAIIRLEARNLQEISGDYCRIITDATLSMIVARHEALESLQLGPDFCERITSDAIKAIALCCPKLKKLRLSGIRDICGDSINALAKHCPNLIDIGFLDCLNVDEVALGNVASVCFLSVAGTSNMKWGVVAQIWHKLPKLVGLDVSRTDVGPRTISRLLSSSKSLKVLCALNCPVLEEETSSCTVKNKGKLLLALFTDIFKDIASLFPDSTKKEKNVFLDWRNSKNKDKNLDEIMTWLEWILSHTLLRTAEGNPQGLDDFWLKQGAALLLSLMQSSQEDVQERAATGLATFVVINDESASIDCGRAEAVMRDGGIRLLLDLAKSWREGLQSEAAKAIANLSVNSNVAKAVAEEGGINILAILARSMNRLVAEEAAGGLWNLSVGEEHKGAIAEAGGVKALVDLIFKWSSGGDGVLERAAGALANLAADDKCSMEVALAGGVHALVMLARNCKFEGVQEQAARALANLAAHGDSNSNNSAVGQEAGALEALVQLTHSPHEGVRQEAAGALWNLSFDDRNREAIATAGGVEALVALAQSCSNASPGLQERAAGALWGLSETTATVLTAALASKKSETLPPGTSVGTTQQGSSSGTAVPSPSSHKNVQSSEATSSVRSEMVGENNTEMDVKTSSEFVDDSQSRSTEDLTSSSGLAKDSLSTVMADPGSSGAEHTSFSVADSSASVPVPASKRNIDSPSGVTGSHAKTISAEANEALHYEKADAKDDEKVNSLGDSTVSESTDVHLNIRLPNGVSLQEKFAGTSILKIVKDYVDINGASGLGSYDLAVPYPRRVLSNEDLSKSLFELSLFNRQALIVVPRQRASGYHGGGSSSLDKTSSTRNADSSNESGGGYFAYVRSILSYVNPFAYFRSGANSSSLGQDSQAGMWEYSPNPAHGNNLARRETNDSSSSSGRNDSRNQRPTTSRIGSNIHTLKRDEDDNRFSDRNAFWNGNSTQYGGDNNGR